MIYSIAQRLNDTAALGAGMPAAIEFVSRLAVRHCLLVETSRHIPGAALYRFVDDSWLLIRDDGDHCAVFAVTPKNGDKLSALMVADLFLREYQRAVQLGADGVDPKFAAAHFLDGRDLEGRN